MTFGGIDTDTGPSDLRTSGPLGNFPSIAPLWHDWAFNLAGSDQAYYLTLGAVGSRRMIIQWNQAISVPGTGVDSVTFEAKLFEGSNNIEFDYLDATVADDSTISNGANSTVGIRDTNGQLSNRNLQWSFDQAVIADNESIKIALTIPEPSSSLFLTCSIIAMGFTRPRSMNRMKRFIN